jgi:protein-tyrosine-phosphatase
MRAIRRRGLLLEEPLGLGAGDGSTIEAGILEGVFRILFLCTGNRCRSPIAEGFVRARAAASPVEVSSAGLLDLGPAPALPEVLQAATAVGLDVSAHRARPLGAVALEDLDLIIGLERSHVAAAVVEKGAPYEKTFTLVELVRLLEGIESPDEPDPEGRARAAVKRAHEARVGADFVPGEDIEDPFGGPEKGYIRMATLVQSLTERLLAGLFGRSTA